jgi:hypothetical protein
VRLAGFSDQTGDPECNLDYRRLGSRNALLWHWGSIAMPNHHVVLDEQLVELLRTVVEECWISLPRDKRSSKEDMIARVFDCAERGERDPEKLKQAALLHNHP